MKAPDAAPTPAEVGRTPRQTVVWHVLGIALAVSGFAAVWLVVYGQLGTLIWENPFVVANQWAIPVGVMLFSLVVGLAERYLHAPNVIEGGIMGALQEQGATTYRAFGGTLLSSFCSLLSGASVGPEAALGSLAVQISRWLSAKLRLARSEGVTVALGGMAAAYNAVVGSPVFATLFVTELNASKLGLQLIGLNLAAGVVGALVFTLLGIPAFAGFLSVGQPVGMLPIYVVWAILLGLVGMLLGTYTALAVRGAGRLFASLGEHPIARILVGATILGIVYYFVPDLMFSGAKQIHNIMGSATQYGPGILLLMALAKPLLLAVSLKSGYLGGPIFPALFSAVTLGLALNLLLPEVPVSIVVPCLEASIVTLLLQAPLTGILLVSIVAKEGGNPDMLCLITASAVTSLLSGQVLRDSVVLRNRRAQTAGNRAPVE